MFQVILAISVTQKMNMSSEILMHYKTNTKEKKYIWILAHFCCSSKSYFKVQILCSTLMHRSNIFHMTKKNLFKQCYVKSYSSQFSYYLVYAVCMTHSDCRLNIHNMRG